MARPVRCGSCKTNLPMDTDEDIVACPECGTKNRVRSTPKKPDMVIPPEGQKADRWGDLLPEEPEPEPQPGPAARPRGRGGARPASSRRGGSGLTSRGTKDLLPKKRRGARAGSGGAGTWVLVILGLVLFVGGGVAITAMVMSGKSVTGDTQVHKTVSLSPQGWKRGEIDAGDQWSYKFRIKANGGPVRVCLIKDVPNVTGEDLRNMVKGNSIEVADGKERELKDEAAKPGKWVWYVMNFSEDQSVTVTIDFRVGE